MLALRRLLVPVDFSACSQAAIDYAALVAEKFHSEIHILYVWHGDYKASWCPDDILQEQKDSFLMLFEKTEAGNTMKSVLSSLENRVTAPIFGRVEVGDPAHTILQLAEHGNYDLIVMGTQGRSGMSHHLLGSLAENIVRHAECPVMTVRANAHSEKIMWNRPESTKSAVYASIASV